MYSRFPGLITWKTLSLTPTPSQKFFLVLQYPVAVARKWWKKRICVSQKCSVFITNIKAEPQIDLLLSNGGHSYLQDIQELYKECKNVKKTDEIKTPLEAFRFRMIFAYA